MARPSMQTPEGVAAYSDLGEWARHYSVVRMTLGTFWLGFPLLVLQQQWSTPDTIVFWVVIGMCLFGLLLYALFTAKAVQFTRRQIWQFQGNASDITAGQAFLQSWASLDGMYPGLIAYILVAVVAIYWRSGT